MKKDVCLDVFKNLNIVTSNQGIELSPCCLYPTQLTNEINFYENSLLSSVRNQWDNLITPTSCQNCSRKEGSNKWYHDHGYFDTSVELIRLDYWTGNTCNLRCAICGPNYSSAWATELKITPAEFQNNITWKTLDLTKLKYIHFNGGEPLLSKEHVEFLEAIPNKDQVHINYNTNGTVLPTKRLLNLWGQFNLIQLDFSIDDIDERFNYQRYPANWDEIKKNLQWYVTNSPVNCMFAVNTTVSMLNQFNLTNLNQWLKNNFSYNRLGDPVEHRTQPAKGLFSLNNRDKQKIKNFLDECDYRRGTNWQSVFPELTSLLT